MSADTREISITFPTKVDLSKDDYRVLHDLLDRICKRYEAENPGRVMWAGEWGGLCTSMPITAEDERNGVPLTFDMDILHVGVNERADYRWPCAKCGHEQGNHKDFILRPPAGDCDFAPGCKPPIGINCDGKFHRGWNGHDPYIAKCPRPQPANPKESEHG